MDDVLPLIKQALGDDVEPFDYVVDGQPRTGWRTYLRDDSGTPRGWQRAMTIVEQS